MHFFYLINGWAGRNGFLDAALRFFYVLAVPILATVLVAFLLLVPRPERAPSRWRVAWAAILAWVLCALSMAGVNYLAARYLNAEIFSPRPFVTHSVTCLVVEPNDNSFPCPEVMLAAALATLIWAAQPGAGLVAWCAALLLGFARIFCGSNYPVDITGGIVLGGAWAAVSLAILQVPLQLPWRAGQRLVWRPSHQAAFSCALVVCLLVLTTIAFEPIYGAKARALLSAPAAASPVASPIAAGNSADAIKQAAALHEGTAREGEGMAPSSSEETPAASVANGPTMGGYLPDAEKHLLDALNSLHLQHRIVAIDVAEIKVGNTPYRCAVVRFEVKQTGAGERKLVARTAADIARGAFHVDAKLQNVDVLGVLLNDPSATGEGRFLFEDGSVPVFTASIARASLVQKDGWLNLPNVDPGMWLRARSRLYINDAMLPAMDAPASATQAPAAQAPAAQAPAPGPQATPSPTSTPLPQASPSPAVTKPAAPLVRPVPRVRPAPPRRAPVHMEPSAPPARPAPSVAPAAPARPAATPAVQPQAAPKAAATKAAPAAAQPSGAAPSAAPSVAASGGKAG